MNKIYKKRCRELLYKDKINGLNCYIITLGSHPCSYIDVTGIKELEQEDYYENIDIPVHGGITYINNGLKLSDTETVEGKIIGWDYAHYNDYYYDEIVNIDGKKYTLDMLIEEVKEACKYIKDNYSKED